MTSAHILVVLQVVAAAALILVGSLVEGYGYGLSLGTSWPYRADIMRLAFQGDPEAWHRIIATLIGVNAVAIAILLRSVDAISGLALAAATALLGVATLNVLAGKAPAFLHGLHAVLAYATLCAYVFQVAPGVPSLWSVFERSAPLHGFLLMVFLGGMVTGKRGYQKPIGAFIFPRTGGQVVFAAHFLGWLLLVFAAAWFLPPGSVTLVLALLQGLLGFALYQSVNLKPARPGILAVFHQGMALLILFSLMFAWRVQVPHTG